MSYATVPYATLPYATLPPYPTPVRKVGAPLVAIIALGTVAGLILSLLGAIPVVGEILVGLFALPAFGVSLFVVYLMIVFGFGWEPAVVTLAVDGLLTSLRQRNRRLDRTLFNVTEPGLSMLACGLAVT